MDPVLVPSPSKEAFNKQRPMSDLIRAQIRHFKHLEEKLPPELRASLPQHRLITEDDAARYIAPMTKLLCAQDASDAAAFPAEKKPSLPIRRPGGLALAATADQTGVKASANGKLTAKRSAKKSSADPKHRVRSSREEK